MCHVLSHVYYTHNSKIIYKTGVWLLPDHSMKVYSEYVQPVENLWKFRGR